MVTQFLRDYADYDTIRTNVRALTSRTRFQEMYADTLMNDVFIEQTMNTYGCNIVDLISENTPYSEVDDTLSFLISVGAKLGMYALDMSYMVSAFYGERLYVCMSVLLL